MKVTYDLIDNTLQEGVSILSEVYPSFRYKGFTKVKIGKSRTSWGSVRVHTGDDSWELHISNCFEDIQDERRARNRLLSTIVHELIHTIPGCLNHGSNFKYYASLVNRRYPNLKIQRCTSMKEFGIQDRKPSYILKCSGCGKTWNYSRKPKIFDYITRYSCPYCHNAALHFTRIQNIDI